jgi:hypothetical protein
MGICTCKEGKSCSVHFFRRHSNPDKYKEDKEKFESTRTPEFKVKECKCSCECDNEESCNQCDCNKCECIQ